MEKPLVSIVIPTYNRAHLIGETIASIQKQTYTNWECIIVDDNSTDDTESLILKFIENDARISFYKKPKHLAKGPSSSRNYGFIKSNGNYINWFDSDDLMHSKKLEIDLRYIKSGDYDFTISQSEFFKVGDKATKKYWNTVLWNENSINDFITKKIGWSVNSPLWNRKKLESFKMCFDDELMTADDYFYHIQALSNNMKPVVIDKVLVLLREHEQRLNNFSNKAPYKLKVNLYLMHNSGVLKLNSDTLTKLKQQCYNQILRLLKHKELFLAWSYYKHFNIYGFEKKKNMYRNFMVGFIYKYLDIGYSYFK